MFLAGWGSWPSWRQEVAVDHHLEHSASVLKASYSLTMSGAASEPRIASTPG